MPRSVTLIQRITAALLLALATGLALAATPVHIAVLAVRPPADVQKRWQPLIDHLNAHIPGYRFQCDAFSYADLETAIARRSIDFVLTNPGHYVLMTHRNSLSSPLATLVPVEHGRALAKFGGVIFARADRGDIAALDNLRGRSVAATSKLSLGGYQAQAMELQSLGIRIPEDTRLLETDMPHDLVVNAVLDGRAEAGFVRTGVLEDMAREGKLDLARVKLLSPRNVPDFPLMLSTRLYPEWPFAAMPGVDEDLARQVAAALLSLPHDGELARGLGIKGFTIPTDYETVADTLRTLRLPPFEAMPQFTTADIWNKYRWELSAGIAFSAVIALLTVALVVLAHRLAEGKRRIQQASQEWHRLLMALGEGVYGVDDQGRCTFINPAALAMLGYSAEEVRGHHQHQLFHHHHEDGTEYAGQTCPVAMTLADGETRLVEDWFWRKDGSGFPVMLTTASLSEQGPHDGVVAIFRDISERRRVERQLREEATTDALTGLANRRVFLERVNIELDRFRRFGEPATLLMVDLDHFKKVNDTYGHAIGDAVLQHFAGLSGQCLRRVDLIGRLGGEEFAILLPGADSRDALQFAERFRQLVMNNPAATGKGPVPYTISLGVTEFEGGDTAVDGVLARADLALYRAKARGRNAVELLGGDLAEHRTEHRGVIHLAWKGRYDCGEATIDQQHRQLFRLVNTLLDHVSTLGTTAEVVNAAFDALLAHVEQHFADEEAILCAHEFPHLEKHAASHRHLLEQAHELHRQVDAAGVPFGDLVDFLVKEVVVNHLLHEDQEFSGLFREARQTAAA